jgi:hypothetical protein
MLNAAGQRKQIPWVTPELRPANISSSRPGTAVICQQASAAPNDPAPDARLYLRAVTTSAAAAEAGRGI